MDPFLCNVQYFMRTKLGLHFVIVEFIFRGRETWRTATNGHRSPQRGWVPGGGRAGGVPAALVRWPWLAL